MNPWQELLAGSPQATALLSAAGQPTRYQQLAQAVQAARARLRAVGLGPEDHLLVLAEGGPTCLLNLLAASAWCRCVVLAGNTPAFDLQRCQAELQARAVLGSASWLGDWARPKDLVWLRPTPSGPAIAFDPQRSPCSHEQPCEFPFIVATSGTTGQRKWVELGRTQVLIGATSVAQGLQLGPGDVGLTLMPLHHVHGLILSTLSALASGGCALLPEAFDPHHLCSWIHSHQPSWYSASPSLHQAVLAPAADPGPGSTALAARRLSALRPQPASGRSLGLSTAPPQRAVAGLRHLHLGQQRPTQGRGRNPRGHQQPPALDAAGLSLSAR